MIWTLKRHIGTTVNVQIASVGMLAWDGSGGGRCPGLHLTVHVCRRHTRWTSFPSCQHVTTVKNLRTLKDHHTKPSVASLSGWEPPGQSSPVSLASSGNRLWASTGSFLTSLQSTLQDDILKPRLIEMVKICVNLTWKKKDAVKTKSRETNTGTLWKGLLGPKAEESASLWSEDCSLAASSSFPPVGIVPLSSPEELSSSHQFTECAKYGIEFARTLGPALFPFVSTIILSPVSHL